MRVNKGNAYKGLNGGNMQRSEFIKSMDEAIDLLLVNDNQTYWNVGTIHVIKRIFPHNPEIAKDFEDLMGKFENVGNVSHDLRSYWAFNEVTGEFEILWHDNYREIEYTSLLLFKECYLSDNGR